MVPFSIIAKDKQLTMGCYLRYLPLWKDGQYATGITTHWDFNDLIGIEACFGKSSYMSGSDRGVPFHFALSPDERLSAMWLRYPQPAFIVRLNAKPTC